jgi:hypothetical protein
MWEANKSTSEAKFCRVITTCKYFRLNINLDTFMVTKVRQKTGFMEKIKCINYEIQKLDSFIVLHDHG